MQTELPKLGVRLFFVEFLAAILILGVIAPTFAVLLFTLVFGFPVIVLRMPDQIMLGWGWIGLPAALIATPPATAFFCFKALRLVTPRALPYVIGGVLFWGIVIQTPLAMHLFEAVQWLGEVLK